MSSPRVTNWKWLRNGDEAFPAMLAAIDAARQSIRLETYIYSDDELGRRFREALLRAQQRGVTVKTLVDGIGSHSLPDDFWTTLQEAGGECRVFNPIALKRFGIRNHRKLLVCDDQVAFIGGFNISQEYEGDGIVRGWHDLGLRFEGALVKDLAASFDEMFAIADFRHKRLARLWQAKLKRTVVSATEQLLLGGPGRGWNPIRRALHKDLAHARRVQIIEAYFLPTWRIRRALARASRKGGEVQLILAGKSDVALSQLAGRSLYQRLLKSGSHIHEYQPQILHAKLLILGDAVYVGSANLDPRSLSINYELMVRFENPQMATEAREIFTAVLLHSEPIQSATWKRSRSFWTRLKERWAYFLLARVDPHVARRQWKSLPD
ncbi:MAG: phosphatidylserine/phosphatidylglycerophosphate/cardiolipin synthase family protein [Verrucomicrobiota bacterium]